MSSETYLPYPTELVLYLTDPCYLDRQRLERMRGQFEAVTVAGSCERPAGLPDSIRWHQCSQDSARVDVWNRLLSESESEWVLFLEDDEKLCFEDLPAPSDLSVKRWYPAQILHPDEQEGQTIYHQMRLVTALASLLFDGVDLPDCTRMLTQNGVDVSRSVFRIERVSDPYDKIETEKEFSARNTPLQVHLLEGRKLMREKKYVHAAAHFRNLLKREKLLPFDRLAAVNGLAQCYTEQYKWEKAINLSCQSIEAEPNQFIPWLILFRIYQLRQQWEKAYLALEGYHKELSKGGSMASFDKAIDRVQSLNWLVKMAMRAEKKPEALSGLEQLVAWVDECSGFRGGEQAEGVALRSAAMDGATARSSTTAKSSTTERSSTVEGATGRSAAKEADAASQDANASVDLTTLYRDILDLSVELEEKEKAHFYFNRFEQDLDPEDLQEIMSGFMEKGWYDLVSDVYTRLYEMEPDNPEYGRRLIASLTKQGKLQEARKLVSEIVSI